MMRSPEGDLVRAFGPKNRPMPVRRDVGRWRPGPLLVGALLAIVPPIGVWLLWTGAGRHARDARITMTVLGAFAGVLEAWVVVVTLRL